MSPTLRHGAARLAALASAAALLAGCAGMDGLAPHGRFGAPSALRSTVSFAAAQVGDASWPAPAWWQDFGDAQLDQLQAQALTGSPTLQSAQARVDKARALAGISRAALRPQLDAGAQGTRQRFSENDMAPPPLAGNWRTESRLALDFGYEFDFWGKNRAALAAANGEVQAARVDAYAARLMLTVAVARGYVQLARIDDQLDIAHATLAQRRQIFELTRQRVANGIDTRVELKQAEAALPAAQEEIESLNEAAALARDQLAALLGQGPDRGLEITRPQLRSPAAATALPSRLNADLLGRRPDVAAARWRAAAAARRIDVAKAQFYPDVDLLGVVGVQGLGLSNLLHAGSGIAGIGPAIHLPIFEGGRLRSRLAGADADYDSAVAQYNQTLVDALRDFADQLAAARSVAAQGTQQRIALAATQEAYTLALLRYRDGIGNYLSVLSAQAQELAQRRLEADLRARTFIDHIELVRTLGGGFAGADLVALGGFAGADTAG